MNKLISIIIPVYNVEKYLEDCLNSVVNQTYKNLEIILIDDGSTDNSGKICDLYAKKDNRIVVIHKENAGVSSARNVGLKIAKGLYIGFVDPDDYIAEDMYEILYQNIIKNDYNISVCKYSRITDRNFNKLSENRNNKSIVLNMCESMYYMLSPEFGYDCSVWNKLYKKDIIKNFDEKIIVGEDLWYNFKIFMQDNNKTIFYVAEKYYYYNRLDSACRSIKFRKSDLKLIKIWKKILVEILQNEEFYKIKSLVQYSLAKTIWIVLLKLSYQSTCRNRKIFYILKNKYGKLLRNFETKNYKDHILKILYFCPYDKIGLVWKIWRYIKYKNYEK